MYGIYPTGREQIEGVSGLAGTALIVIAGVLAFVALAAFVNRGGSKS